MKLHHTISLILASLTFAMSAHAQESKIVKLVNKTNANILYQYELCLEAGCNAGDNVIAKAEDPDPISIDLQSHLGSGFYIRLKMNGVEEIDPDTGEVIPGGASASYHDHECNGKENQTLAFTVDENKKIICTVSDTVQLR